MYRNQRFISCCLMAAWVGGMVSLSACGETSVGQPAAMALGRHAVVNGVADTLDRHRAVVGLYVVAGGRNSSCSYRNEVICTGTLIHPKYVLTAAHCVTQEDWNGRVQPGACNRQMRIGFGNSALEVSQNLHKIKRITYHPDYGEYAKNGQYDTLKADIALIELSEAVAPQVALPIKTLPPRYGITREDLGAGQMMNFSGFGYSDKGTMGYKLQMDFPVTNYCGGDDDISGCEAGSVLVNGCHPSPDYCDYYGYQDNVREYVLIPWGGIYYPQEEGGPCQGDSGGPAFLDVQGEEYLAGITSYGDIACAAYGVSTATQDYYDWIVELAPEVAELNREHCANGLDDDGNGLADCADPVCAHSFVCVHEICDNDLDDNFDGLVDCVDPTCASQPHCQAEICDNGEDDNADGLVDCLDPQCMHDVVCQPENCTNGIDDNLNGLVDCRDPQCAAFSACIQEDCTNGVDDNFDGLKDCAAPQCSGKKVCQPEICDNGMDDNDDGLRDAEDPGCADSGGQPSETEQEEASEGAVSGGCSTAPRHSAPVHALPLLFLALASVCLRRRKNVV